MHLNLQLPGKERLSEIGNEPTWLEENDIDVESDRRNSNAKHEEEIVGKSVIRSVCLWTYGQCFMAISSPNLFNSFESNSGISFALEEPSPWLRKNSELSPWLYPNSA